MKKIIAMVTAFTLIFSLMSYVPVNADTTKIDLKQAIEIAKQKLSINSSGYDFTSNYSENQDGQKRWDLNWNSKTNQGSINAAVDAETGEIISFNQWENQTSATSRIPKYSKDDALKAATEFANKLVPDKFKQTKPQQDTFYNPYSKMYYSDTYNFTFVRQLNNIPVTFDTITINIDRNNLKVRNYNMNWTQNILPDKSKALSLEEAKKAFSDKLGIELAYYLVYPQPSGEPKPILVYTFKNGNRPIDAITGEVLNNTYYGPMFDKAMGGFTSNAKQESLTPQEQKVVDDNSKYITKEAAMENLKKLVSIDENYKLTSSNLYAGYNGENAAWNFNWSYNDAVNSKYGYIGAAVDAVTGEVKYFYTNNSDLDNPPKDTEPKYNKEQAKDLAAEFLQKIQPDKFKATEYRNNTYDTVDQKYPTSYNYNFIRKENGIACSFNSFNVTVSSYTGKIIGYTMNWSNIKLPVPDAKLSLDEAYKVLFSKINFGLSYIKVYDYKKYGENPQTKLAYVLDGFSGLIDAKTGSILDYNGDPIKETTAISFTDIKGNAAENDIKLLVDMGIIDSTDSKFFPSSAIKQKDFIKLIIKSMDPIYYPLSGSSSYDTYYDQAIQRRIISKNDKRPEAIVTKQEAAKMLVKALGIGFVADMSEIYKADFKDANAISSSFKGYTVIASELGITKTVNGYYSPKKQISRGEAATMIVKYLKVDTTPKE